MAEETLVLAFIVSLPGGSLVADQAWLDQLVHSYKGPLGGTKMG